MTEFLIAVAAFAAGLAVYYAVSQGRVRRSRGLPAMLERQSVEPNSSSDAAVRNGEPAEPLGTGVGEAAVDGSSKLEAAKAEVLALLDAKLSRMVELEDEIMERESITAESTALRNAALKPGPRASHSHVPLEAGAGFARPQTDIIALSKILARVDAKVDAVSAQIDELRQSVEAVRDAAERFEAAQSSLAKLPEDPDRRQTASLSGDSRIDNSSGPLPISRVPAPDPGRQRLNSYWRPVETGIQLISRSSQYLNKTLNTLLRRR